MLRKEILLTFSLVLLAGCSSGGANYILTDYGQDENFKVVEMKTYDETSGYFTFRYDETLWTLEEWPEDKAPNRVALVHTGYADGSCYMLPGTIGQGQDDGNLVYEGSLLTSNHVARTLEVTNSYGIRTQFVVGYEIGGIPYIFEVNFPLKDQDACEIDSQALVSTFYGPDLPETIDGVPIEEETDTTETDATVEGEASGGITIQGTDENGQTTELNLPVEVQVIEE